jgi:hypothetical protein
MSKDLVMLNAVFGLRFLTLSLICMSAMNCAAHAPAAEKPHHTPSGFRNLHEYEEHDFWDLLRWRRERANKEIPGPESYHFPLAENDAGFLKRNVDKKTVTWIGHATVLLQVGGYNILTHLRQFQNDSFAISTSYRRKTGLWHYTFCSLTTFS